MSVPGRHACARNFSETPRLEGFKLSVMRKAGVTSLNRILIAGDGTLLVADSALTDPRPVTEVLPADQPLRIAAEAVLGGREGGTPAGLLVRRSHSPP
ncbi:MAG: hypothetical protein ACR2N4_13825, partial [Jatrophihabitans sp.]